MKYILVILASLVLVSASMAQQGPPENQFKKDLSGTYSVQIVGVRTDKKGGGPNGEDAVLTKQDMSYLEYGILMHYLIDAANRAYLEMALQDPNPMVQKMPQMLEQIDQ